MGFSKYTARNRESQHYCKCNRVSSGNGTCTRNRFIRGIMNLWYWQRWQCIPLTKFQWPPDTISKRSLLSCLPTNTLNYNCYWYACSSINNSIISPVFLLYHIDASLLQPFLWTIQFISKASGSGRYTFLGQTKFAQMPSYICCSNYNSKTIYFFSSLVIP